MDYIEDVLKVAVSCQSWKYKNKLPLFMIDKYDIKKVKIGNIDTIFLFVKSSLDSIPVLKKHISKIQKLECLPVVFVLKSNIRTFIEYLIQEGISFIVPYKQIYLPFMGMMLKDNYNFTDNDKFLPSTQVVLFYYFYKQEKKLYIKEIIKYTGFSGMTITRAIRQLEQTGYFFLEKAGTQKILCSKYSPKELYEQLSSYLISPVRKIKYVSSIEIDKKSLCLSGLSALSSMTMINPDLVECFAVKDNLSKWKGSDILLNPLNQVKIEIWKYSPFILAKDNIVDPLSLIMTLKNENDEHIQEAVESLLKKVW